MRENLPIEVKFSRRNAGDGVPYAWEHSFSDPTEDKKGRRETGGLAME